MIADIIGIVMHFLFLSFSILVVCLHFFSCFFTFLLPLYILIIFPFCFYCSVFCTMRKSTNLRNWQFLGQSKLNNSNVLLCILMGFSALGGVEGVAKWWLHEKKLILRKIDDKGVYLGLGKEVKIIWKTYSWCH